MIITKEYIEFVITLTKPPSDILNSLTLEKVNMLHAAIGIATETSELNQAFVTLFNTPDLVEKLLATGTVQDEPLRANIIEEFGDLSFYLTVLETRFCMRPDAIFSNRVRDLRPVMISELIESTGALVDVVKRYVIHNKPLETNRASDKFNDTLYVMNALADSVGISASEIIAANIAKLQTRYDGLKYSDSAANARADKKDGE